jgi:hypothetical protein
LAYLRSGCFLLFLEFPLREGLVSTFRHNRVKIGAVFSQQQIGLVWKPILAEHLFRTKDIVIDLPAQRIVIDLKVVVIFEIKNPTSLEFATDLTSFPSKTTAEIAEMEVAVSTFRSRLDEAAISFTNFVISATVTKRLQNQFKPIFKKRTRPNIFAFPMRMNVSSKGVIFVVNGKSFPEEERSIKEVFQKFTFFL